MYEYYGATRSVDSGSFVFKKNGTIVGGMPCSSDLNLVMTADEVTTAKMFLYLGGIRRTDLK